MNVNSNPINRVSYLSEVEGKGSSARPQSGSPAQAYGAAKVEISASSRQLAQLSEVVSKSSDVREDLVASLKARIDSGSYKVDYHSLAQNLAKGV